MVSPGGLLGGRSKWGLSLSAADVLARGAIQADMARLKMGQSAFASSPCFANVTRAAGGLAWFSVGDPTPEGPFPRLDFEKHDLSPLNTLGSFRTSAQKPP